MSMAACNSSDGSTTNPDNPPVVDVTGIRLDADSITLKEGTTKQLTATVLPENATDKTITWSSADDSIATVTNGLVSALKEGQTTVTAAISNFTATCKVAVTKEEVVATLESITVEYNEEIEVGGDLGLVVKAHYSDGSVVTLQPNQYEVTGFDNTQPADAQEVIVTFEGEVVSFTIKIKEASAPKTLVKIEVSGNFKTEYELNEQIDLSGIIITAYFSDGSTLVVPATELIISGFDTSVPGEQKVTITYQGQSVEITLTIKDSQTLAELVEIRVSGDYKKEYEIGENLDLDNMIVTAVFSDGSTKVIEGFRVSGFDSTTAGEKSVIISYEGVRVAITVTVKDASTPAQPSMVRISVDATNVKKEYESGNELDLTGLVVKGIYSDGSEKELGASDYRVSGYDSAKVGEQTITVTVLGDNGAVFTGTFTVTVKSLPAPATFRISLDVTNVKKVYEVGEELDTTGLIVNITYSTGETGTVDLKDCEISGFDSSKPGKVWVKVSYLGVDESYEVQIGDGEEEQQQEVVFTVGTNYIFLSKYTGELHADEVARYVGNIDVEKGLPLFLTIDKARVTSYLGASILEEGEEAHNNYMGNLAEGFTIQADAENAEVIVHMWKPNDKGESWITFWVSGGTSEEHAEVEWGIYVVGTFNDWSVMNGFKMTVDKEDTNLLHLELDLKAGDELCARKYPDNVWYNYNKGNIIIGADGTYMITVDISLPEGANRISAVRTDGGEEPPEPTFECYVVGSFSGWKEAESYKMTVNPKNENIYTLEGLVLVAKDEFLVKDTNNNWYKCGGSDKNITGLEGTYTITVDLSKKNKLEAVTFVKTSVDPEPEPTLTGIELNTESVKKEYEIGEYLNLAGLVVKAVYSNGEKVELTAEQYVVDSSRFDSSSAGDKEIFVSYSGKADTFKVNVKAAVEPDPEEPEVDVYKVTIGEIEYVLELDESAEHTGAYEDRTAAYTVAVARATANEVVEVTKNGETYSFVAVGGDDNNIIGDNEEGFKIKTTSLEEKVLYLNVWKENEKHEVWVSLYLQEPAPETYNVTFNLDASQFSGWEGVTKDYSLYLYGDDGALLGLFGDVAGNLNSGSVVAEVKEGSKITLAVFYLTETKNEVDSRKQTVDIELDIAEAGEYDISFTNLDWDLEGMMTGVAFVVHGAEPDPEEVFYYLVGTLTSWEIDDQYQLKQDIEQPNRFLIDLIPVTAGSEFKVKDSEGHWYGIGAGDGENLVVENAGVYRFDFFLNAEDNIHLVATVIPGEEPEPDPEPSTITITVNLGDWANDGAVVYAWVWGNGFDAQWIRVEDGKLTVPSGVTGLKLVRLDPANSTMRVLTVYENINACTIWNGPTGDISYQADKVLSFVSWESGFDWVNP